MPTTTPDAIHLLRIGHHHWRAIHANRVRALGPANWLTVEARVRRNSYRGKLTKAQEALRASRST